MSTKDPASAYPKRGSVGKFEQFDLVVSRSMISTMFVTPMLEVALVPPATMILKSPKNRKLFDYEHKHNSQDEGRQFFKLDYKSTIKHIK